MIKNSCFYDIQIKSENSFSVCLLKKSAIIVFARVMLLLIISCFILHLFSNEYPVLCLFIGVSTIFVQARKLYHLFPVIKIPTLIYENGELSSDGIVIAGRDEKLIAKVKTVNVIPLFGYSFEEYHVSMQAHDGGCRHLFSSSDEKVIIGISRIIDSR